MAKFEIGDRISWMAVNGECSGVVMVHDDYNLAIEWQGWTTDGG